CSLSFLTRRSSDREAARDLLNLIDEQEQAGRELQVVTPETQDTKGRTHPVLTRRLHRALATLGTAVEAAKPEEGEGDSAEAAARGARPQGGAGGEDDEAGAGRKINEEAEQPSIEQFFNAVASGLVEAQRKLDDRSERYLESLVGRQHLSPTVFRLPKVSGEIKFGMTDV